MASDSGLRFSSRDAHRAHLAAEAALPAGFSVGTTRFDFTPVEAPKPSRMTLTLIALDEPSPAFAAMFTKNALVGAPVLVGRRRLDEPALGAILVNNKVANVGAPGGQEAAEEVSARLAGLLGLGAGAVLPCSTGVIGWRLPTPAMLAALPAVVAARSSASALPAAEGIMTTDLYPKLRRVELDGGAGSIVAFAKGAGMIEPHLATMLAFVLTDLDVPREALRAMLPRAVHPSFGSISIDGDTSTSDAVVAVSSRRRPCRDLAAFEAALAGVCARLAEDVVRNGEGVHHVVRVAVTGAPDVATAKAVGRAVVRSPLVACAVAGNDPNVGRIVAALGKHIGLCAPQLALDRARVSVGGHRIFEDGRFALDRAAEEALVAHLRGAELYASVRPAEGVVFTPPVDYPPHEARVEIEIDLQAGQAAAAILGADLTHEYISENADYRS